MNIEARVGRMLVKSKMTIAIAESCTGGLISNRITNIPGSSKYFLIGIVAYSNRIKENVLGVPAHLLQKYGAVSEEVALEMAKRVRLLARADIGVGVTGIAGPAGGTKAKPVGLVYIGLAANKKRIVKKFLFKGSRRQIKLRASQAALNLICAHLSQ